MVTAQAIASTDCEPYVHDTSGAAVTVKGSIGAFDLNAVFKTAVASELEHKLESSVI